MAGYAVTNTSPEDLEKFRDTEGYINLDKLIENFPKDSREMMGTEFRDKNWLSYGFLFTYAN